MQFSNDGTTWSIAEAYATTKSWTLTAGDGTKTVYVKFTDPAGNSATAMASINFYSLIISNVGISLNSINTYNSESSTVFFTIDGSATVTLKIVPEKQGPSGTPIYQTSQACSAAGAYLFTWNGQDNSGRTVPDEAYLYILEAVNGTQTGLYSPAAPTGTGSVTCSQDTYNPYKNNPLTISYTVSQPERVDLTIAWGNSPFKVMDGVPHLPGTYTFDWDGRNPGGSILGNGGVAHCAVPSLLRENHIITSGDAVKITSIMTDPYEMHLAFGQFTRIKYTLSKDANVTVKLISPAGSIITVISNEYQAAGAHEVQWNGLDSADPAGARALFTEEGDYRVSIQAINPSTNTSTTARGSLKVKQ
jgi:flagellar hook assembly protein FlgD